MTEKRIYKVQVRKYPKWMNVLHTALNLGVMVVIVGWSHAWFGGSWVIDIFALFLSCILLYAMSLKKVDNAVAMTPEELREWVVAGCPDSWNGKDLAA